MEEKLVKKLIQHSGIHEFHVSFAGILKNLRRFLALWISVSVIVSILAVTVVGLVNSDKYQKTTSLISFTFDGVEKGVDPNGNKFSVNTIKSFDIIEKAAEGMDIDKNQIDAIRRGITFEGKIPQDAINRITSQSNIFAGGKVEGTEQISETTYYPTQYTVHFNYAETGLNGVEAAELINRMLEIYGKHFFDVYGYNQSLDTSINTFDYEQYDYAEAVDIFDSSLRKLATYINQVAATDTTRFRSKETDFTLADLTERISVLRSVDLESVSSYIDVNSVTRDKETLLTYYNYRVEALQRDMTAYSEELNSVNESIKAYEKNQIIMYGASQEENDKISASQYSAGYDALFDKKEKLQTSLSTATQEIGRYNKNIQRLSTSTQTGSATQKAKVEEELAAMNLQLGRLIDETRATIDDYYKTVVFPKAYNVLEPAAAQTVLGHIKHAVKDSVFNILIIDAVILVVYLLVSVILAIQTEVGRVYGIMPSGENKKAPGKKEKGKSEKKNDSK